MPWILAHGTVSADEKAAARNELKAFLADLEATHQAKEGSYAFYDCNGAKGDLNPMDPWSIP